MIGDGLQPSAKETPAGRVTVGLVARFLAYFLFPILLLQTYVWFAMAGYAHTLARENHVMEWLEFSWLFLAAAALFFAGRKHEDRRGLYRALMILPLIAGVRELDDVFEELLFDKAWYVFAGILWAWFLAVVYRRRNELGAQIRGFIHTRAFAFLVSALLVFIFSQVFGQQELWKAIMGEHYVRDAKRIIEETCELLAYSLLFIGSLECRFQ